ncbi:hypothetical protein Patl1_12034 [Pistacia atlantica]|uniref:Uncharacterized protein n=1 Tax=Pistacia atlantica TaxID=434234 RepID=A0ACC1A4V9_9ROSI|nr:hypothetical protein Patl1_12034 [Pistacia atlantica]
MENDHLTLIDQRMSKPCPIAQHYKTHLLLCYM